MSELGHIGLSHTTRSDEEVAAGNRAARRRSGARRRARLAGAATTAVAGAMVAALTAPQAFAADSSLQPQIDQILAAQQQIIDHNSAYPFASEYDITQLPMYTQRLAMSNLNLQLAQMNYGNANSQYQNAGVLPYLWNAPGANPLHQLNTPNPDDTYHLVTVGDKTQTMTITPNPGSVDVTFTMMTGNGTTTDFHAVGVYDLSHFTPNADGTYTVTLSPTQQPGNWIDTSGSETMLMRDTSGDWGQLHDVAHFNPYNLRNFTLPVMSKAQIAAIVDSVGNSLVAENGGIMTYGLQKFQNSIPANTFTKIAPSTAVGGPILPGQYSSFNHFVLQPGQALVVKVPDFDAGYTGAQINNAWTVDAPFANSLGSLNNTQTFHSSDGYTYYVLSGTDPGVGNWIDTGGAPDGNFILRWQAVNGAVPTTPVVAQVVNISDVRSALPADTPNVTPSERAAQLKERMFEYNYRANQSKDIGWVIANLQFDQIRDAVGGTTFDQMFGTQDNVPSVLDRIVSPSLRPDVLAVTRSLFANPQPTLAALWQNLPLAANDVALPIVLAVARVELVAVQTFNAIRDAITTGQPLAIPAALANAVGGLVNVVNKTLTDPATSITAGFLNARDDLATAVLNAKVPAPAAAKTNAPTVTAPTPAAAVTATSAKSEVEATTVATTSKPAVVTQGTAPAATVASTATAAPKPAAEAESVAATAGPKPAAQSDAPTATTSQPAADATTPAAAQKPAKATRTKGSKTATPTTPTAPSASPGSDSAGADSPAPSADRGNAKGPKSDAATKRAHKAAQAQAKGSGPGSGSDKTAGASSGTTK